jgi:hypothetical protein
MSDYFTEIQKAIRALHACDGVHLETVPVKEVFQGQTAWEGDVEIFQLGDNTKAKLCYAWGHQEEQSKKWIITTVLGIPPVTSAQNAVKASLAVEAHKT